MSIDQGKHDTEHTLLPYLDRYGLRQPPFTPDAIGRFYFEFASLTQQLNLIHHLVQSTHLILLVLGGRGAGKTTFLNRVQIEASENIYSIPLDARHLQNNDALLKAIANHFRLPTDCGRVALLHLLDEEAYKLAREDRIPLLVIDNAHLLNRSGLELILQLCSGTGEHNTPWHILLCSEPKILTLLSECEIDTSNDPRFHISELPNLSAAETASYIQQRMTAAGLDGPVPLSDKQIQQIHAASNGCPGEINSQTHQALMVLESAIPDLQPEEADKLETPQEILEQEPMDLDEALEPDIVELPPVLEPLPEQTGRKTLWPKVLLGLFAIALLASALLFQDKINTLFSNNDIIVTPNRIEPLQLPEKSLPELTPPKAGHLDHPPIFPTGNTRIEPTPPREQAFIKELQPKSPQAHSLDADKNPIEHSTDFAQLTPAQQPNTQAEKPTQAQGDATPAPGSTLETTPSAATQPDTIEEPSPQAKQDIEHKSLEPPHENDTVHDAAWLLQQDPALFTLQILGTDDSGKVDAFFHAHPATSKTAHYLTHRNGKDWHIIVQGLFTEGEAAQQAIALLPEQIRREKPWVRKLAWIHRDIHSTNSKTTEPAKSAVPAPGQATQYDADKLLQQDPASYTLQLLASQQYQNTLKFLAANKLERDKAFVYLTERKQRQLYILLYGNFPDAASARKAITQLPASVRKLKPWGRPLRQVQQEIEARN